MLSWWIERGPPGAGRPLTVTRDTLSNRHISTERTDASFLDQAKRTTSGARHGNEAPMEGMGEPGRRLAAMVPGHVCRRTGRGAVKLAPLRRRSRGEDYTRRSGTG